MIYSNVSRDFIMPPSKYLTLFNSRLICLAASSSVFLTCSSQVLLLASGYCCSCPCSRPGLSNVTYFWPRPHALLCWYFLLTSFHGGVFPAFVEPKSSAEVCLKWGPPQIPVWRFFLIRVIPAGTSWGTCRFLPCALPHAYNMLLSPTTLS